MEKQVTRHQLFNIGKEVQQLAQSGSILSFWMEPKIREFYNQNGARLKGIGDKLTDIFNKFHEIGEDGKPTMETPAPTDEVPNPVATPKLKPFHTDEGFQKERQDYMNEVIKITL